MFSKYTFLGSISTQIYLVFRRKNRCAFMNFKYFKCTNFTLTKPLAEPVHCLLKSRPNRSPTALMEVGSDDSEEGGSCHVFSRQISSPKVFPTQGFWKAFARRQDVKTLPILNPRCVFFIRLRMHPQPGSRIHVPKPNLDRSLAGYVAGIPGKLPASQSFIALSFKACLNCGKGLSVGLFFFATDGG